MKPKSPVTRPRREKVRTPKSQKFYYSMACMLMFYVKDDTNKQRHLNVLVESEGPNLHKTHLAQMQRTALSRLKTENDIDPDAVKDAVIVSMSPLGFMTNEEFEAT